MKIEEIEVPNHEDLLDELSKCQGIARATASISCQVIDDNVALQHMIRSQMLPRIADMLLADSTVYEITPEPGRRPHFDRREFALDVAIIPAELFKALVRHFQRRRYPENAAILDAALEAANHHD